MYTYTSNKMDSSGKRTIRYKSYLIFLLIGMLSINNSFSEGTREFSPTAADDDHGVMQIFDNNDPARNSYSYTAPTTKQLKVEICNPGEVMYFGFNYDPGDLTACDKLYYRIRAPSGAIVFGPQQVTNAGAGSIANYTQAFNGPKQLLPMAGYTPASGYNAILFDPVAAGVFELGSFVIEFNRNDPNTFNNTTTSCTGSRVKTRLRYADITVADGAGGNRINGRVWCQTWDLNCNSATNAYNGSMYVYSDDGIVTKINFNGIQPFGFSISCNRSGVSNTGNVTVDRQSVNTNSTYAQYRIFLNDPDENCFPIGIFGNVTGPVTVTGCDKNNRCINITVDKAGDSQLLLNFNGVAGYQPGTSDVLLKQTLVVGTNCIPWNGKDGLGNYVPTGGLLDMQLDYFNGLTHLPIFDVENWTNGVIVTLIHPVGPTPQIFWDDSQIPKGTVNLAGCTSGAPPAGCHKWGFNTNPDGTANAAGWGNNITINSWWYANYIKVTANYNVPGNIAVDANTNTPGVGAAANADKTCTNSPSYQLAGSVTGATGGKWTSSSGNTAGFSNSTSMNGTYTPSPTDTTNGSVKLFLTSTGNGACPAVTDTILITILKGP